MKIYIFIALATIAVFLGSFLIQENWSGLLGQISSDTRLPFSPYGLTATVSNYNQVNFSWTDDSSNVLSGIPVTEFRVFRRQTYGSAWSLVATVTAAPYLDENMPPGSYDYRADACNNNGCTVNSSLATISIAPDSAIPTTPENLAAPQKEVTDSKANLYWEASSDNMGIKYYNIYRSISAANNFKLVASASSTTYIDSSLAPSTNYHYHVRAVDFAKNESIPSKVASIITNSLIGDSGLIRIVSPNGGECFTLPGNLRVAWTGTNVNNIKLSYGGLEIYKGQSTVIDWYMTASVSETSAGSVKVVAVDGNGVEGISDSNDGPFSVSKDCSKSVQVSSIPAVPTLFKAILVPLKRDISLSWQDNSKDESEFRVYRRQLPTGSWKIIGKTGPNITNYADVEVPPGDYEYDANACNSAGCSAYSTSFKITAVATLPGPRLYAKEEISQGDMISSSASSDPDIYIINEHGFKRLFLNPAIFAFYGHLGGFQNVKNIEPSTRDVYKTSVLFKNCENEDGKIYALEVTGEDEGTLHWLNLSGEKALTDDPDFFKKVFCINNNEFNWYKKGSDFTSISQVPKY